ncbi:MAG: hypothetical protein HYV15_04185 [Elusimicrobia bacterium]|nr:hypothetical protein [Elusimicrobiota bacterium]
MPDYFPVAAGMFWTYEAVSARGRRVVRVEIVAAEASGGVTRAAGRSRVDDGAWLEFSVVAGPDAVRVEGVVELPLPPVVGAVWTAGGDSLRIASDRAAARTPAGRFTGCLRVEVLLSGGDAGSAERYYAPGLGLVRESVSEEGDPSDKALLSYGRLES